MHIWKVLLVLIFNTISLFGYGQESTFSVIPEPRSVKLTKGFFSFNSKTQIIVNNSEALPIAGKFSEKITNTYNLKVRIDSANINSKTSNTVWFLLSSDKVLGKDGYKITIMEERIWIEANEENGFSNATQSLLQLLQSGKKSKKCNNTYSVPCGEIVNY